MKTETLKNIDQTVCDHSSIAEVQIENLTFHECEFGSIRVCYPHPSGQSDRSIVYLQNRYFRVIGLADDRMLIEPEIACIRERLSFQFCLWESLAKELRLLTAV